jgi:Spy/CpxP family protein refolding chaperone
MSSKLKPWLLLAVIFIVGVVTGSALTYGWVSHFRHPPGAQQQHPGAQQMGRLWMAQLVHRLNLSPDQAAKIQPILVDARNKIQMLHRDEMERGDQIFMTANDQIAAILPLTPEQKVELQKMESERKKMFLDHMRPWGPPRDGPGGPFHGGPGNDMVAPPPPPPAPDAQTNEAPTQEH